MGCKLGTSGVAGAEGREVCSGLELIQDLPLDALTRCEIPLTGQQQDIHGETQQYSSVHGASEILNQINDSLQ